MSPRDLTPAQQEFQERLSQLLAESAKVVGPFSADTDDGVPMDMPVPVAWILVVDWDDAATLGRSSIVSMNSGARYTQRLGMMLTAMNMIERE